MKQTQHGVRDLVYVTITDDSGDAGAARSTFPALFSHVSAEEPSGVLKQLLAAVSDRVPVAFFNMIVFREDDKTILKTCKDNFTFQIIRTGEKAERLLAKREELLAPDAAVSVVTDAPAFAPAQNVDYSDKEAILTVCCLLELTREGERNTEGGAPGASEENAAKLFQLNHVRIVEPKAGENVLTSNGDRLWPNVRLVDSTGSVDIHTREKTALTLSGQSERDSFVSSVERGALNFPILCSAKVVVKKSSRTGGAGGDYVDTCIVEAVEQDIICPRSLPNKSVNFLSDLLRTVAPDPSRMIAAPMESVKRISHVGLAVDSVQVSCVLSLLAPVGRSETIDLEGGHKIVSRACWNIPFQQLASRPEGAPEHCDSKINGEVASYCTMENVQDYTLTARKASEPVYALVVVSGVHGGTRIIEKVQPVNAADIPALCALLRRLGRFATTAASSPGPYQNPVQWDAERTPAHAKKTRRLGEHPTASPMRSPTG